MEIDILGKRVNLLDIDVTIRGAQELINRMLKVLFINTFNYSLITFWKTWSKNDYNYSKKYNEI